MDLTEFAVNLVKIYVTMVTRLVARSIILLSSTCVRSLAIVWCFYGSIVGGRGLSSAFHFSKVML